ncbi:MAG: hypothetical protein JWN30_1888 [Bacilli bacterium]|nr:hypothetical protein [Bacilli bacterium]
MRLALDEPQEDDLCETVREISFLIDRYVLRFIDQVTIDYNNKWQEFEISV